MSETSYFDKDVAYDSAFAGMQSLALDRLGVKTGMGGTMVNKFVLQAGTYYVGETFVGPYLKPQLRNVFENLPQKGRAVRMVNQYFTGVLVSSLMKKKLDVKGGINNAVASILAPQVMRFAGLGMTA